MFAYERNTLVTNIVFMAFLYTYQICAKCKCYDFLQGNVLFYIHELIYNFFGNKAQGNTPLYDYVFSFLFINNVLKKFFFSAPYT